MQQPISNIFMKKTYLSDGSRLILLLYNEPTKTYLRGILILLKNIVEKQILIQNLSETYLRNQTKTYLKQSLHLVFLSEVQSFFEDNLCMDFNLLELKICNQI